MNRLFLLACGLAVSVSASAATHATRPAKISPAPAHSAAKPAAAGSGADKSAALPVAKLSATQIVERNVAARGGLAAWRAVDTLTLSGRMQAGGKQNTELPFVMEMKRPHKSRLQIRFQDQDAIQVYDGTEGWKIRPFLGRDDVEPFTADETKQAANWAELDGPLIDYAAKGTRVALDGTEAVEDHPTYKLKLTFKNGTVRHVWIDAATFLERKVDGEPHRLDGKMRNVAIFYRDYHTDSGLKIPHTLETVIDGGKLPHTMTIDQVAVNKPLADTEFGKTGLAMAAASGH